MISVITINKDEEKNRHKPRVITANKFIHQRPCLIETADFGRHEHKASVINNDCKMCRTDKIRFVEQFLITNAHQI